jgi:hypothetical protein
VSTCSKVRGAGTAREAVDLPRARFDLTLNLTWLLKSAAIALHRCRGGQRQEADRQGIRDRPQCDAGEGFGGVAVADLRDGVQEATTSACGAASFMRLRAQLICIAVSPSHV